MTRILPNGIEVKSGAIPKELAPHLSRAEREYIVLGQDIIPFVMSAEHHPGTRMIEAVLAVTDAFKDPLLEGDATILAFKKWLSGFEIKVREWEDWGRGEEPVIRFMPRAGDPEYIEDCPGIDFSEPGPALEVMGHPMNRIDFIYFTDYLMTNSAPTGSQDPRLSLIEGLRFEQSQIE